MKQVWKLILLVLLAVVLPVSALAAEAPTTEKEIIYLDDGAYITVEMTWQQTRAANTKTASKTYTYTGSNGNEQWRAVMRGTFTYNGTTASCTAASCDVTILDTAWYVVSKTASPSGNAAVGALTMGRKLLGITISKESVDMRISCDPSGNLS